MLRMGSIFSLLIWAKASTIMLRLDVCHSSLASNSTVPIRRMMESSFRKIPTTSALRFTSLLSRSIGFA